MIIEENIIDI